jgi:predicted MFS family arabinose efflux permease
MPLTLRQRILRVILPFCAGYFFSYLMRTINAVLSPELTRELSLSAADLGLLTSTYFFSFALAQIPVGIALDRFGARRVAASLLVVAAIGAFLFSAGQSLTTLAIARALIGLGVAACLMAGLKGFMDWFDLRFQPSLTGIIMASGALGALTTSVPVTWALPLLGWRGIFVAAGVLALVVALVTAWVVPQRSLTNTHGRLADSLSGVAQIFRSRDFWRFAPQSGMFTGCFMALQGLWVVPWLMNVNQLSRAQAAEHLFFMSLGMLAGQLGIAALLARSRNISPYRVMQVGLALMMTCEALAIQGMGSSYVLWAVWAMAAAAGSQMYGIVASYFPGELAGRATTSINLMAFIGAFALQWGLGGAIDGLRATGLGIGDAYRMSFGAMLLLQLAAYGWMLRKACTAVHSRCAA